MINPTKLANNSTQMHSELRKMDKLMRQANNEYPRISPYRVNMRAGQMNLTQRFIDWINKIGQVVDQERDKTSYLPFWEIIKQSTKATKQNRLGDCAESSSIMMSSLLANGYKDGKIARLLFEAEARDLATNKVVGRKMLDTTHEFVVRNLDSEYTPNNPKTYGKNLIVIDAWEGFCSNFQEAVKKYYDSFLGGMREWINSDANLKITYKPRFHICDFSQATEDEVKIFQKEFPELIIQNT